MKTILTLLLTLSSLIGYGQQINVNRISLVVSDMEQSVKWYQRALDMEIYYQMAYPEYDSLRIYFLKNATFELELLEKANSFSIQKYEPSYSVNRNPMIGIYKIGLKVDDLERWYIKLKSINAEILYDIRTDEVFNTRSFIVTDPNGNNLQFCESL